MNWLFSLYVAILFFILTPAVLLRIPKKGGKYTVAGVHAIVFALLLHFTGKFVWNVSMSMEGFQEGAGAQARGQGVGKTTAPKEGSIGDDPKKIKELQDAGKKLCDKSPGKKWNADKNTCETDENKKDAAKTVTDANRANRAGAKAPTKK
jgi:hypothetical protein